MKMNSWQLQEAKSRFSDLVNTVLTEGAQTVTKHGKPAVVVISAEEYEQKIAPKKSLAHALRDCPEDLSGFLKAEPKRVARDIHLA